MKFIIFIYILIVGIIVWTNIDFLVHKNRTLSIGWIYSTIFCGVIGIFKKRVTEGLMWGVIAPVIGIIILLSKPKREE